MRNRDTRLHVGPDAGAIGAPITDGVGHGFGARAHRRISDEGTIYQPGNATHFQL